MNGMRTLVESSAAVPARASEADAPTDFEWLDDLGNELTPAARTAGALPTTCEVLELSGALLARGTLHDRHREDGWEWITVRLGLPGSIIQRCLVGGLREVRLVIGDGLQRRAEVDRLAFDPSLGRLCVLRLADDAPD
jgi:hypothetical protein